MFAQKRSCFNRTPVFKGKMRVLHVLWSRTNVMQEAGQEVSLENW
jgi:hypothetical protein